MCYAVNTCLSPQSYHDPDSEEEHVHLASDIVAGASVTSAYTDPQLEEEREKEEDLPEQPPPAEEKPKEGKLDFYLRLCAVNTNQITRLLIN